MHRWLKGLVTGLAVALAGAGLAITPPGIDLGSLFRLRGPVAPPDEVVVVGINGRSGTELGLPDLPRDWPRSVHGRLVEALVARGARVIAFDIHFGREKDPQDDARFAEAVRRRYLGAKHVLDRVAATVLGALGLRLLIER